MPDDVDDLIDDIDGLQQTFQNVRPLLSLLQLEPGPSDDDIVAEFHEIGDHILEGQRSWTTLDQGDIVEREAGLELGVLEQGVEHNAGVAALLYPDDDADTLAGGLVVDVGDALDLLVLDHLADLLDHLLLVDHIRNLGHNDGLTAVVSDLDLGLGPHDNLTAAGLVGLLDPADTHYDASGREVRSLDVLHQPVRVDVRVVDVGADRVTALAQIVRSHIRGHSDGDTRRTVQKKQRCLCRQYCRLLLGVIEVKGHIHSVLVDVGKNVVCHLLKLGLGVPHGGDRVTVHRSEVTLTENHRVTLVPRLREPGESVIHTGVAVRVVLTEHLADDLGALTCRP